jgi:RNA polymerase sigma-70 factor (ECF subfamily)
VTREDGPEDIEALFRRYANRLWREVIWPVVRDDARAEDALCETFLAALRALPRFDPFRGGTDGTWPWLCQIARRKAVDELRRDRQVTRLGERAVALAPLPETPEDPQARVISRERTAAKATRVAEVLEGLNPRYAGALRMRLQEGASRAECAARFGVELGTFDVLLHRAVRSFREAYLARYGTPPEEEA